MSSKSVPDGKHPWSLAARLTAWYAGSAFALCLLATGFLYWALVASLNRQDDASLAGKVLILRTLLRERPGDEAALRQEVEEGAWAASHQGPVWLRILDDQERLVLQTQGMAEDLSPDAFPAPSGEDDPPARGTDLRLAGGKCFRVLAARAAVGPAGRSHRIVQVALDRSQDKQVLADYRRSLWVVVATALLACTVGGYHIARRGLRPIQEITAMAQRIRPTTLGERMTGAGLPAELLALASTFNAMLDRLEESFGRMARFSADIAHELRTPVNNLRGEVEVALGKPRSAEEHRDVLGSCLEECDRLARLIDSLLFLARAENPKTQIEKERVDVGRELLAVQEFYEAAAEEAGVKLTVVARDGVLAELNRSLFQRAVGNLVVNALAHSPRGGAVTLTASGDGTVVGVEVRDDGCGIAAAHLPYLLDRFYRVDGSRSSAAGGVGLGLAIVKVIAELHGGMVAVASEVGRGTRATLSFPAPGAPAATRPG
jgi:two-component system heavy metal sensor histidine kinase CusS